MESYAVVRSRNTTPIYVFLNATVSVWLKPLYSVRKTSLNLEQIIL